LFNFVFILPVIKIPGLKVVFKTDHWCDYMLGSSQAAKNTFAKKNCIESLLLPAHVTAAPSLAVFRQRLKTFLFSRSYPDIVT